METDNKGFEDLVVEYDDTYKAKIQNNQASINTAKETTNSNSRGSTSNPQNGMNCHNSARNSYANMGELKSFQTQQDKSEEQIKRRLTDPHTHQPDHRSSIRQRISEVFTLKNMSDKRSFSQQVKPQIHSERDDHLAKRKKTLCLILVVTLCFWIIYRVSVNCSLRA